MAPIIDLSGPDGNAFVLMGFVHEWGRQLGVDTTDVLTDMRSGDYDHLLEAMQEWAEGVGIDLELQDES